MKSHAKYKKPPVTEVVSGLVLEPVPKLKVAHLGAFWPRIMSEFPECEHAIPLGLEESIARDLASGSIPLPRLWFINKNQDELVQLQRDRFYFNWREGPNRSQYSTYDEIYRKFSQHWTLYREFLAEMGIGLAIRECELTYVNHISHEAGWTAMSDIDKVMGRMTWQSSKDGFLPAPRSVNWQALFDLPADKGRLSIKLQPAFRGEKKEQILLFELSAKGIGSDRSDKGVDDWFETAHEWIVKGFEELTDRDVQRSAWGKER